MRHQEKIEDLKAPKNTAQVVVLANHKPCGIGIATARALLVILVFGNKHGEIQRFILN